MTETATFPLNKYFSTSEYVYDGDTLWLLNGDMRVKVRLYGIDTPEIKGQCEQEIVLAEKARDVLKKLVEDGVYVVPVGMDRYKRQLVVLYDDKGTNINQYLVRRKLAKSYPPTAKGTWCKVN